MFNRIALFILAALTGAGAVYGAWVASADASAAMLALRIAAALLVVAAMLVTWEAAFNAGADRERRLKGTALVVLVIGIAGLASNAFFGGLAKAPDGPVFVTSLLLILQSFLTIGYASRAR